MTYLNKRSLTIAALLLLPIAALAQESKVALIDFERAIVGSAAGQRAAATWNARYADVQKGLEARQKEIEDAQNRLRTQGNVLSEAVKAEMARDIERKTTDLNRASEDAQREMEELRATLLQPISAAAQSVIDAYAREMGYTLMVDISNPQSGIVYVNERANVTDDVIKRIDAAVPAAPAPATPASPPAPTQ